jgi:hypothetical protein
MTSYKDMTFCRHYKDCEDGNQCYRALTMEVVEAAEKWWGNENAPISSWVGKPECFTVIDRY